MATEMLEEVSAKSNDSKFVHQAFFIIASESSDKVVFSSDGLKVLACAQPVANFDEGSVKFAEVLFQKFENRQIFMICKQDFKSTTLWTARSHLLHCHQMFCDFDELSRHNSNWVQSTILSWDNAIKKSLSPNALLGKRPMDAFITVSKKPCPTIDTRALRRTFVETISRGLLPFSFVNSPGNYYMNYLKNVFDFLLMQASHIYLLQFRGFLLT
jgi:hypothetical protein